MGTDNGGSDGQVDGYIALYLLPVPRRNLDAYRVQATRFGQVAREHGALSYREFQGDDLGDGFAVAEGSVLTSAVAEFESRAHRDAVMERVMSDPRIAEVLDGEQPADMAQMRYGGFRAFVRA